MSAKKRLKLIKKEVQDAKKQAQKKAHEVFHEEVKNLFDKFPELESFSWDQFTPYFNDGDTCEFYSNHGECGWQATIDGEDIEVCQHEGIEYAEACDFDLQDESKWKNIQKTGLKIEKAIASVLSIFEQDDFQIMFGDHITVVVDKSGVKTFNCNDHD